MEPISQIGLLCRACVSPLREERYNLIETPMLFELYIRFSSTNISPDDSLPKSICSKCHRLLYDFQDFQRTCVESHKILYHHISIGALKLENDEEFAIKNESSSEISQTTYSIEYMDEFIDIKLETNDSDPLMDQQDPGSFGGLMTYTAPLPDEATFSIEHMDQGSDLKLENNDSDQWRERKDEEPFGSPKEYCDPLPDLDFKDEALVELPEEVVAESISSKSLEVGNSIRRTYSKRLRKKTDVVEDGTQMIGQKNRSSKKPQPNQFLMKYMAPLPDEAIFSIEHMDQGSDLKLKNNDSDQWRKRKDEEPFGSPKKYCDPLPDLDFKDEALVELPEEIVAESISSKSLERGNSIQRTYSKRLRKKTDVVEDGTQMIGQKNRSSVKRQPNQFVCEKCLKKFRTKVNYEGHLRWHEGKTPYECKQCYAEYTTIYGLKRHVLLNHTGNEVRAHGRIEDCEKNYLNKESLELHMETQSRSQIYELLCKTLSKKSFKKQEMMYEDYRSPQYLKPMRIDGKLIYELVRENLTRDILMDRPRTCDYCQKKFFYANELKRHNCARLRSIKKYRCSVCGMTSTTITQLQAHMVDSHTREEILS